MKVHLVKCETLTLKPEKWLQIHINSGLGSPWSQLLCRRLNLRTRCGGHLPHLLQINAWSWVCQMMFVTVRIMVGRKRMLWSAGENDCKGSKISNRNGWSNTIRILSERHLIFSVFPENLGCDGILCNVTLKFLHYVWKYTCDDLNLFPNHCRNNQMPSIWANDAWRNAINYKAS